MTNRQTLVAFALGIFVGVGLVVGMYAFAQSTSGNTRVQLDTSNCRTVLTRINERGAANVLSGNNYEFDGATLAMSNITNSGFILAKLVCD